MTAGLRLGRPGVYAAPPRPDTGLQPVRLDVAGFVGVAARGPVDTPVAVSTWSDYQRRFGGFERLAGAPDRLLPYAVQAFFAQGGALAQVVRVAPPDDFDGPTADEATARLVLTGEPTGRWELQAADEGSWGGRLTVDLGFEVAQSLRASVRAPTVIVLPVGAAVPDRSLVRVRRADLPPTGVLRLVHRVADPATDDRLALLDLPLPDVPPGTPDSIDVDVVTGVLVITDTSPELRRSERITGVGLAAGHPRFVTTALAAESELVRVRETSTDPLVPSAFLRSRPAVMLTSGSDRHDGITFASFFDDGGADADPLDEDPHHRGVDAIGRVAELGLLCVPDLTWRAVRGASTSAPLPVVRRPPSCCDGCEPAATVYVAEAPLIRGGLDALDPGDLAEIVARQDRLLDVARLRRRFIVLLDVPAGLPVRGVTDWRARIDTSFAAAYHPWLGVPRATTGEQGCVAVPPSSFAAGIIAGRERRHGLPWGPANEFALGAVLSRDVVTDAIHDQLHRVGINVYRADRGGFRLSAARTLSLDPEYVQLSVRRLMTMLALTLERQTHWLVFEPNTPALRARLTHTVTQLLRGLQRRGAFAGGTDAESFFVACDDALNPVESQAQGRLVAEVGVAPAAPLEYLVLQITRDVDGAIAVGTGGG